jgi:hypothetical protein
MWAPFGVGPQLSSSLPPSPHTSPRAAQSSPKPKQSAGQLSLDSPARSPSRASFFHRELREDEPTPPLLLDTRAPLATRVPEVSSSIRLLQAQSRWPPPNPAAPVRPLLMVKFHQPSHEFTFGVGITFIPYPLVLTPLVQHVHSCMSVLEFSVYAGF